MHRRKPLKSHKKPHLNKKVCSWKKAKPGSGPTKMEKLKRQRKTAKAKRLKRKTTADERAAARIRKKRKGDLSEQ